MADYAGNDAPTNDGDDGATVHCDTPCVSAPLPLADSADDDDGASVPTTRDGDDVTNRRFARIGPAHPSCDVPCFYPLCGLNV